MCKPATAVSYLLVGVGDGMAVVVGGEIGMVVVGCTQSGQHWSGVNKGTFPVGQPKK